MAAVQAQIWKGSKFNIERKQSDTPGEVIFSFSGPFTLRDMYGSLSPVEMHDLLETIPSEDRPDVLIFDLTRVPYMDSAGIGLIANQYAKCHAQGIRFLAVGVCARVLEQFKMTKLDTFIPLAATVDEADREQRAD